MLGSFVLTDCDRFLHFGLEDIFDWLDEGTGEQPAAVRIRTIRHNTDMAFIILSFLKIIKLTFLSDIFGRTSIIFSQY